MPHRDTFNLICMFHTQELDHEEMRYSNAKIVWENKTATTRDVKTKLRTTKI